MLAAVAEGALTDINLCVNALLRRAWKAKTTKVDKWQKQILSPVWITVTGRSCCGNLTQNRQDFDAAFQSDSAAKSSNTPTTRNTIHDRCRPRVNTIGNRADSSATAAITLKTCGAVNEF